MPVHSFYCFKHGIFYILSFRTFNFIMDILSLFTNVYGHRYATIYTFHYTIAGIIDTEISSKAFPAHSRIGRDIASPIPVVRVAIHH
jgi:hypothetical protein